MKPPLFLPSFMSAELHLPLQPWIFVFFWQLLWALRNWAAKEWDTLTGVTAPPRWLTCIHPLAKALIKNGAIYCSVSHAHEYVPKYMMFVYLYEVTFAGFKNKGTTDKWNLTSLNLQIWWRNYISTMFKAPWFSFSKIWFSHKGMILSHQNNSCCSQLEVGLLQKLIIFFAHYFQEISCKSV